MSTVLLALTVTAGGLAVGTKLPPADATVLLFFLVLWGVAGFSVGWTASQWPVGRIGHWVVGVAGLLTNWIFLLLLMYARSLTWHEDSGELQGPRALRAFFRVLIETNIAFWSIVALSVVIVLSAAFKKTQWLLLIIGLSLFAWLVVVWWALLQACDGYA